MLCILTNTNTSIKPLYKMYIEILVFILRISRLGDLVKGKSDCDEYSMLSDVTTVKLV